MTRKQRKMLLRIFLSAVMLGVLGFLPVQGLLRFFLYLIPYLLIGYDVLWDACRGIWNRQVFDENFLMAIATVGALVLGAARTGDYVEAVAVMLFYQLGELFQSYAIGKSRKNIAALMDIRPDYANVEKNGILVQADPEEVEPGSIIIVKPGEKVPIDGVVVEGASSLNTAALTGESVPRDVCPGHEVLSGCINMTGLLKIRTTRDFGQSTVAKILELVENAGANKSRSEQFITKFARIYTPAVCALALILTVLPPAVSMLAGREPLWTDWLYRALTFLVASCPCALVISIPLTFFAGIGGASRAGILIKGANYMEALSKAGTVVLDKTGTLTQGVFHVSQVVGDDNILELAAHAEDASSHPIAKSLVQAWGGEIDHGRIAQVQELGGHGVTAKVDGAAVAVGNSKLMAQLGISVPEQIGTVVYVAVEGRYAGHIRISDAVKPTAAYAMEQLRRQGVQRLVMLTGDNERAARQVAESLKIDEVFGNLLPGDKVAKVEGLLARNVGGTLVFVGDGINDAPVLSRADVGIAMGALGSDAAIEAADVVLMDDDPAKLPLALRLCRKCMGIVYQNIAFALAVKLGSLVLVALGMAGMGLAIFADVGVMVLAVLNAIRALRLPR